MTSPDLGARIKERITMQEVAERYGLHFDTRGRTLCPFHDDHHPSATIKYERFHCWVCGLHLDAIDFVRKTFDLTYPQALERLDADFGLRLTGRKPDPRALDEWRREQAAKEAALEAYQAEYDRNTELYRYIWRAMQIAGPVRNGRQARRRAAWAAEMDRLEYYFSTTPWK